MTKPILNKVALQFSPKRIYFLEYFTSPGFKYFSNKLGCFDTKITSIFVVTLTLTQVTYA